MAGPWEKYANTGGTAPAEEGAAPWKKYAEPEAPAEEPEASEAPAPAERRKPGRVQRALIGAIPFVGPMLRDTDLTTLLPGAVSGMSTIGQSIGRGGVGATAIDADAPGAYLAPAQNVRRGGVSPAEAAVADRQRSITEFDKGFEGDIPFQVGKVAAPVLATMPLGPLIGRAVTAAAPTRLGALGEAIGSGGFKLGASAPANPLAAQALRATGGAINAGAQAAVIDPENIGKSALLGAVLPGGVRVAEKVGTAAAQGLRRVFPGQAARDAAVIARVADIPPAQLPDALAALRQEGPHIVQAPGGGSVATAPQILQNPGISQLQRALRNAGDTRQLAADQAADAARDVTLARVGTAQVDPAAARSNFGNALEPKVRAADEAARVQVNREFEAVDPFNETKLLLPIDKMRAAREKFLGRGTFGKRAGADAAIDTAEDIGTEVLPAVKAAAAPKRGADGLDLFEAIKRLGGIKQDSAGGQAFAGELQAMKQSGARSVIQNGRGQSPDTIAEAMHAQGYLPDADPDTLFAAMRQHGMGDKVYAVSAGRGRAARAGIESAMGDAPGAERIAKTVPFGEVQNLRSSIGEAWDDASKMGRTREAAALDAMRREIDTAVDNVAKGRGTEAENFPPDIVKQWRAALDAHAARMEKFRTGPQEGIFRANGPRGGELAGQFFSPRLSQAEDIAAFRRIADPETSQLLKDVTVTELDALRKAGRLSPAQVDRYLAQRGEAVRGLFTDAERAQLTGLNASLQREAAADTLNNVKLGSNTAQNLEAALGNGFLDSPLLSGTVGRLPVIGRPAGALLEGAKSAGKKARVDRLGKLLADPLALERALAQRGGQAVRPLNLGSSGRYSPLAYRALPLLGGPLLSSDQ